MPHRLATILILALSLLLNSCLSDPESRKKRFLANGNKYHEKGKYREASIMFRNALKEDARFGEAYYRLALTSMKLGQYGDAFNSFQRAAELQPDNLDAFRQLSDLHIAVYSANPKKFANSLKEAQDLADRMKKTHPSSFEYLRLQGMLHQLANQPQEALDSYLAADKAKPNDPDMKSSIAACYVALNRMPEAEELLKKLLVSDKSYLRGYDFLYGLYARTKRFDEAEQVAKQRIEANPTLSQARLALAAHYATLRNEAAMTATLEELTRSSSKILSAYDDAGTFYARIGNHPKAIQTFEEGLGKVSDETLKKKLRTGIVASYSSQGKISEAQVAVEGMLKTDPQDPDALALRAHLWLMGGKPENLNTAIADLQSIVSKRPDNAVLRFDLGNALLIRGDLDAAKVQLLEAIKLRPDFFPARNALAQLSLQKQDWTAALQYSQDVLAQDPKNMFGLLVRSHALMATNDFPQAKALLQQTIKDYPQSRDARYQLGFVSFQEKNYKVAEESFRSIYYADQPDLRGLMGLTETYMAQNQYDTAAKVIDAEIAKYPKALALQIARGSIAARAGQHDQAVAIFKKAVQEQSKVPDLYLRLAEAQRLAGDASGALESWRKASELDPNLIGPLLNRATTLDALKRRAEARPLYEQILKIQPDQTIALNNLAYLMAEEGGELDAALTLAQRAKQKAPNDPMISDTLGWIYIKKGLANSALPIFNELTAKFPAVAVFHYHLAMAHSQRGDNAQAKRALDAALKASPQKQELEDIKKLQQKIG
jgi:tetratricopeptide (TPR) repeat protein